MTHPLQNPALRRLDIEKHFHPLPESGDIQWFSYAKISSCGKHLLRVLVPVRGNGEYLDVFRGTVAPKPPANLEPVYPRHPDVQNENIGLEGAYLYKRVVPVRSRRYLVGAVNIGLRRGE